MNNKTEKKKRKFLSDEEKMEIIKLHHLEGVSQCELARRYDTRQPVVSRIISKFAAENDKSALLMKKHTTDSLSEENKALRKEVMKLKKQLYHEKMWADFYDTMV
ncbi:MAG: hypothetical protein K6A67_06300, partial [Bacteroidales bacterium]|nr:hypothetical protein [Bacteroidales bacterium]